MTSKQNSPRFLDTILSKGERLLKDSDLDVRTFFKPIETFHYTHFASSYPAPGVKKGFIKGKALRLLRTNTSKINLKRKSESSNHTFLRGVTRRS